MPQEEHTQRYSNSSGGDAGGDGGGGSSSSRSSKKLKAKKVPQRGLGVAQLEKIRIEEQQKKDGSISSPISLVSQSTNSSPNFRHNPSGSFIPLPPPLPTDLSYSNSIFGQDSSIPSIDFQYQRAFAPSDGDGGEIGWSSVPDLRQGYVPKFWNDEYSLEGENHGLAFLSNVRLPFEFSPICAPPIVIQRSHQLHQHHPSTSLSMVNVSSGTSSSSRKNYPQMEPPSNQSFYGNNNTPLWSEEEKMVGRKRPYPFSVDNVPGLSFPYNVPPVFVPPTNRSNEPSCANGGTANVELNNLIFREGSSSSSVLPELNPKKAANENVEMNGDFLTLAPLTTAVPHPRSKSKHPLVFLDPHNPELPDFESLPFQGSGSTQQQPFYTFYPPAKARVAQVTTTVGECSGGVGENLDLNLKL